jgi:subfamily B ATP-binding cassette protein MsbA
MSPLTDVPAYLKVFQTYIGRRMYVVLALSLAAAIAEGFGIVMLLPLLESINAGGEAPTGASKIMHDILQAVGLGGSMVAILIVIGIAFLIKGIVRFVSIAYTGYLQAQLMRELKARLFDAYSHMDYRYYVQRDTGHFINVINTQIQGFYDSFGYFISFLTNIITTLIYFSLAFFVAWRFGLMALGLGLVMLVLFRWLNIYVRELSRRTSSENGHLSKLLIQSLQAFKYLAATEQFGHLRNGIMSSIHKLTGYRVRQQVAGAFTASIGEPLSIFFIILIVIVQILVLEQPLAPIMVSILLFHRGMGSVLTIQNRWQLALNTIGSVEMVRDEFDAQHRHREPDGNRELAP